MTVLKENSARAGATTIVAAVFISVLTLFFIIDAKTVSQGVLQGLRTAAFAVIPAVFPCAVLSELFILSGGGEVAAKLFGKPISKVFGTSVYAASAVILGAVCGFPVGAVTTARLYSSGKIKKAEIERLIGFVSLPSPSFVINVVGVGMFGSRNIGFFLFGCLLLSSFLIGVFSGLKRQKSNENSPLVALKSPYLSENFVSALYRSAETMIKITASVTFFSAVSVWLGTRLDLPDVFAALLSGILEFSGGCRAAAALGGDVSLPLCAFFLGFSGFGVHFQIISVCGNVSFKKYFAFSLIKAALCALFVFAVKFCGFDI